MMDDIKSITHKTAYFENGDNRLPEEKFAKENAKKDNSDPKAIVRATYATGQIQCGQYRGSANLIGATGVIVTAMHISCEGNVRPEDCIFTYQNDDGPHSTKMASAIPGQTCEQHKTDFTHDWVVLKLASAAVGVNPYKFDRRAVEDLYAPQRVYNISNGSLDFCARNSTGKCLRDPTGFFINKLARTTQPCTVRYVGRPNGIPLQHESDCAGGEGNSGSAIVDTYQGQPTLLSIISNGARQTKAKIDAENRTGKPNFVPYDDDHAQATTSIPIAGDLADAIENAIN